MTRHSILLTLALCILAMSQAAGATEHRSRWVPRAFQHTHPCPSTGLKAGKCPGWVKDHIVPLCSGGPDTVANLQWQTVAAAKVKDREEWKQCRLSHSK
jgi:hypothetical protein